MTVPDDVAKLLDTLIQLGVDGKIVAKAKEIFIQKADDMGEWIELAVALREREQFDAAVATYDAALRRFPDSHILWSNRGILLLIWELYEEALKNFSKALEIKPDYINALAHKASVHEQLHEFEKAVDDYRAVLELEPNHSRAWNSMGVCLQKLGRENEAIPCFENSNAVDPDFTDPLFNLAGLYNTRRKYENALQCVSRLLEINPHDFQAIELRDEILAQPEKPRRLGTRDKYVRRTDPTAPGPKPPRSNLYRPDRTRRPDAEIIREQGKIGLRMALLDDAIYRRSVSGEALVNYPLRLFLSYKWGTDAENEWVAKLADKLAERGWNVVFDKYRDETIDRSVETFVSRLATCSVFLAIATPEYVAHGINPRQPSWVFDEYQVAMHTETGMYRIALAPEGNLLVPNGPNEIYRRSDTIDPAQFGVPAIIIQQNKNPQFDEIHPIPADENLDAFLNEKLTYKGPNLNENERSQIVRAIEDIQSGRKAGNEAIDSIGELLAHYPFVYDALRMLVLKLTEKGRLSEAVDALALGIQNVHPWDRRLMIERERIDLLNQLERPTDAVNAALQVLETRPRDWVAHFYIGNRLDDGNELWGARNHLLIACNHEHVAAEALNTLGVVYLGLGFLIRAGQSFEGALQRDGTFERAKKNLARTWQAKAPHELSNTLQINSLGLGCTVCPAMYPMTKDLPVLCKLCGGRRPAVGNCPYCAHDGVVFWSEELAELTSVTCPTCRIGSLTQKSRFDL